MKRIMFCLAVVFLLVLSGCSSITGDEAKDIALGFVNERVKFFSKDNSTQKDVDRARVASIDSYEEDGNWVVVIHVASEVSNGEKGADLVVKVDSKGKVLEFNGQKVG